MGLKLTIMESGELMVSLVAPYVGVARRWRCATTCRYVAWHTTIDPDALCAAARMPLVFRAWRRRVWSMTRRRVRTNYVVMRGMRRRLHHENDVILIT